MTATMHFVDGESSSRFWRLAKIIGGLARLAVLLGLASGTALAADYCSQTAQKAFLACQHDVKASDAISEGVCINISDPATRKRCLREAKKTFLEEKATCMDQLQARRWVCSALGAGRYDPEINPARFVDPALIGTSVAPNPYFPLLPGRTWVYQGEAETVTVTVTGETREILGVLCAVVHDVAEAGGEVLEDTKDWYAQDVDGNVWYFGEISQQFEGGELVSLEGSWTAGVDGAKPGIIMSAAPEIGALYRQEFDLGNAEDLAKVLNLTGTNSGPLESCAGDCLVTKDFTPIEPGVVEYKYFKPGVGQVLTIDLETGAREELVQVIDPP